MFVPAASAVGYQQPTALAAGTIAGTTHRTEPSDTGLGFATNRLYIGLAREDLTISRSIAVYVKNRFPTKSL